MAINDINLGDIMLNNARNKAIDRVRTLGIIDSFWTEEKKLMGVMQIDIERAVNSITLKDTIDSGWGQLSSDPEISSFIVKYFVKSLTSTSDVIPPSPNHRGDMQQVAASVRVTWVP